MEVVAVPWLRRLVVGFSLRRPGFDTMGPTHEKISCVAYADDVTVIMTHREDSQHLQDAIQIYERATGAQLNYGKSKALAIGAWKTTDMTLAIP